MRERGGITKMKKEIREVDHQRGIVQVTVADERWYLKSSTDQSTGLPTYKGVPSVTWVASFYPKGIGYYKWLGEHGWDESQALMREAGEKGSAVHKAIEMILNGEEFRIDTKVVVESNERELTFEELEAVRSFCDYLADLKENYEVETIRNGMTLMSDQYNYGGTLDWLMQLTPKVGAEKNPLKLTGPTVFLIDFKTSQQVWRSAEMQVSAYKRTIENGENPVEFLNENGTSTNKLLDVSNIRIAILQVGYRLNKRFWKFTEIEDCFDLFLTSQIIWKREAGDAEVKVVDFPIVLALGKSKEEQIAETIVATLPTMPKSAKAK
jgi:hypothetical protein